MKATARSLAQIQALMTEIYRRFFGNMRPKRSICDEIQDRLLGAIVTYPTKSGEEITIRIEQIAWHKTKAVLIGHITNGNRLVHGEKFLGTTQKIFEHAEYLLDGLDLSEDDIEYLTQPWDLEHGQTSHEISARESIRLNALLE